MPRLDSMQRAAILDAAIGVFGTRGFRGATTRLVGRAARVNSALIYYYFENKETLFAEAIAFVLREFFGELERRRRRFRSARERMEFLVDGMFGYYEAHPRRMRLMPVAVTLHTELFSRAILRIMESQPTGTMPVPLQILAEGIEAGELRPMHPIQAWWSILAICLLSIPMLEVAAHAGAKSRIFPPASLAERKRHVVDLLVQGLAEKKGKAR